jgi:hypothetical protein
MSRIFIFSVISLFIGTKDISIRNHFSEEQSKTYMVYINYPDYSVHANVLFDSEKIHAKIGYTYYWYTDNDIKQTDGGFDGKLLHGEYKSFYLNKNLKEQGIFCRGLKEGEWKTWFANGKIHEIIHFKNSLEHGSYEVYDEVGNMVSKSNFKNGVQDGKVISYQKGKVDTIIIYKKGQVVMPKSSKHIDKDKNKSIPKKKSDKPNKAQDTVAKTPKSSFNVKKIINKSGSSKKASSDKKNSTSSTATTNKKVNDKKKILPKKKDKSTEHTKPKKN